MLSAMFLHLHIDLGCYLPCFGLLCFIWADICNIVASSSSFGLLFAMFVHLHFGLGCYLTMCLSLRLDFGLPFAMFLHLHLDLGCYSFFVAPSS